MQRQARDALDKSRPEGSNWRPIMNAMEVQAHAQKLYAVHGPKAVAEAADKAREYERTGDKAQMHDWKKIEQALILLRGPNAT